MEERRRPAALVDLEDAVWSLPPPELAAEEARLRACGLVPDEKLLRIFSPKLKTI